MASTLAERAFTLDSTGAFGIAGTAEAQSDGTVRVRYTDSAKVPNLDFTATEDEDKDSEPEETTLAYDGPTEVRPTKSGWEAIGAGLPVSEPSLGKYLGSHFGLLLQGKAVPARPLFWHYPHYGNQGGAPGSVLRHGDWKLILWEEGPHVELFNLKDDPSEKQDVAAKHPDIVRDMRARLEEFLTRNHALHASPNPAYNPAKPNGREPGRQRSVDLVDVVRFESKGLEEFAQIPGQARLPGITETDDQ